MSRLTHPRVLRRFIILLGAATFVMFSVWAVIQNYTVSTAGDFEVRQGDILIGEKKYDEAIERFDAALVVMPDHRGALMGRGIAFLQSERYPEAEAEFTYLIDFLIRNVEADDRTGIGVLAAAFANRGILNDRLGRYEKALADYIEALKVDAELLEGPNVVDKIIYGTPDPATVRTRALYLKEQLALPADQRLLRLPEKDAEQRMYKP